MKFKLIVKGFVGVLLVCLLISSLVVAELVVNKYNLVNFGPFLPGDANQPYNLPKEKMTDNLKEMKSAVQDFQDRHNLGKFVLGQGEYNVVCPSDNACVRMDPFTSVDRSKNGGNDVYGIDKAMKIESRIVKGDESSCSSQPDPSEGELTVSIRCGPFCMGSVLAKSGGAVLGGEGTAGFINAAVKEMMPEQMKVMAKEIDARLKTVRCDGGCSSAVSSIYPSKVEVVDFKPLILMSAKVTFKYKLACNANIPGWKLYLDTSSSRWCDCVMKKGCVNKGSDSGFCNLSICDGLSKPYKDILKTGDITPAYDKCSSDKWECQLDDECRSADSNTTSDDYTSDGYDGSDYYEGSDGLGGSDGVSFSPIETIKRCLIDFRIPFTQIRFRLFCKEVN